MARGYKPPNTLVEIAADVNASLGKYKAGALNIFGEWFSTPARLGGPADPHYTVTGADYNDACLVLSFHLDSGAGSELLQIWDPKGYVWAPTLFQIRGASRVLLSPYTGSMPVPDGVRFWDCVVEGDRISGRVNPPHWDPNRDPFSQMRLDRPAVSLF